MKAFLLSFLLVASPLLAELTEAQRDELLESTKSLVNEVVVGENDDFDKKVRTFYTGPAVPLGRGCELHAVAIRSASDVQKVLFLVKIKCPFKDWKWLFLNDPQLHVEGKKVDALVLAAEQTIFADGSSAEERSLQLSLEQVLRFVAGDAVKMQIGNEEWSLSEQHKIPLLAVLGNWIGHGGNTENYKDLVKRIFRPSRGLAYEDVVKKYGQPESQDTMTGWAVWEHFGARFKEGKIIETRTRPIKEKAAQ